MKVDNKSLKNMEKFKYLGMMIINQDCIHAEIKSRLNSGNTYFHEVQNLLSSHLLSTLKIKISSSSSAWIGLFKGLFWLQDFL
jgi:hypothetical protein